MNMNMNMNNDTLETTSRFVAWKINSLNEDLLHNRRVVSKEFMMGNWYWLLEIVKIQKENIEKIQLVVKLKDSQSLAHPIVSFVTHIFCSKGSLVVTTSEEYKDFKIFYGDRYAFATIDICTLHKTTPVTFSVEFLDLKMKFENDGETHSVWDENYSDQNPSIEPISKMLSESVYTDIVINTKDGSINAHRAVLAVNSPVFKTMFSDNYIEKETSTVNINDMSIGACWAMLNFMYGKRNYKELRDHIMELIVAADKYDIVKFKKACETILCDDVGANNVFERLKCAHTCGLLELKRVCFFYLFEMGLIFKLREDYNSFIREADPELVVVVSNACLDAWTAT